MRGFLGDERQRRFGEAAGAAVVGGDQRGEEQAAEDPLVHEPQLLRHAVGRAEPQPDLEVFFVRHAGVLHQQLAAHAQVGHERDGGGRL